MSTSTTLPDTGTPEPHLAIFEDHSIRRVHHQGVWYWSVVDIVGALTKTTNARRYWSDLKIKIADEGDGQLYEKIVQLRLPSADGKAYLTDVADLPTIFRIIQAVPSPKAEPMKLWLAQVGFERVQEDADPELTIDRAIRRYKSKGWNGARIKARIDSIVARNALTDEWKARGVEGREYGKLTGKMYRSTFGYDSAGLRRFKGLPETANIRDAMDAVELALVNLGENVATAMMREDDAQGYSECDRASVAGANVAGAARRDIENRMGRSVITTADRSRQLQLEAQTANADSERKKAS